MPKVSRSTVAACPCGTGRAYSACCRPFHLRSAAPDTAEELMRSRYSAFVKRLDSYLLHSWAPETRPRSIELDRDQHWTGLTVVSATGGGAGDETGTVEFIASSSRRGVDGRLHEVSEFVRHDGRWVYLAERGSAQSAGN